MKNRPGRRHIYFCGLGFILLVAGVVTRAAAIEVYSNDFDAPLGTKYPEWTSSIIRFRSAGDPPGSGTIEPQAIAIGESPNGALRFLGEFGGPKIGTADDPGYNRTLVEQTIRLTLHKLPPHQAVRLALDLYVLKSWDGNSPQYGPDRLRFAVAGGPTLLDTSFSNNHKVERQGSFQDYPQPKSSPQTDAVSTNTLGYRFFGDAIYRLEFTFPHRKDTLELDLLSSLFEGKGTDDESWAIDNVKVVTMDHMNGESDAARITR